MSGPMAGSSSGRVPPSLAVGGASAAAYGVYANTNNAAASSQPELALPPGYIHQSNSTVSGAPVMMEEQSYETYAHHAQEDPFVGVSPYPGSAPMLLMTPTGEYVMAAHQPDMASPLASSSSAQHGEPWYPVQEPGLPPPQSPFADTGATSDPAPRLGLLPGTDEAPLVIPTAMEGTPTAHQDSLLSPPDAPKLSSSPTLSPAPLSGPAPPSS